MIRKCYLAFALAVVLLATGGPATVSAAGGSKRPFRADPNDPPVSNHPIKLSAQRLSTQNPPVLPDQQEERRPFERGTFEPKVLLHQLTPSRDVPPETFINPSYIRTRDSQARLISLKEAVYLALRNNPAIQAAQLDPVASLEGVRQSWAAFDPDLTAKGDVEKFVSPTTSVLQTGGSKAFSQKLYDWNFAVNKLMSTTNGTFGITFDNERVLTNSTFASVNPNYNPMLAVSLSQPLLRNFGWDFATINVRIAETNQKQAQFTYEQNLNDFVLKVISDYWNVVRAEQNLQVARDALKLAADLVRQNEISVRVGVLAPIQLQESQSEQATREAGVFQAEDVLTTARAFLRQDVMLNPSETFIPAPIEAADHPNPVGVPANEEESLELAMEYRPELASMRELIRSLLLQVKNAENQTLPQLTFGGQIGITSTAGLARCNTSTFGSSVQPNCTVNSARGPVPGNKLPFGGIYGDSLNRLWNFSFYNYAVALNFERPIDNDASKAALAQTKIEYEQQRLRYRDAISQIVVDVERAIADLQADLKRARATEVATRYAQESLRAEEERFRVGMATTHELLQFQDELVFARGNQVAAEVDLEIAKAALRHSQGTLLRSFNIDFVPELPNVRPWYAHF